MPEKLFPIGTESIENQQLAFRHLCCIKFSIPDMKHAEAIAIRGW